VIARRGFAQATVAQIARAAGYTTGMVAHYFDSKQQIILAALRLILRRLQGRLAPEGTLRDGQLLELLTEALPVDETRYVECACYMAFWGQISADRRLKRINGWLHREYLRIFDRCLARGWSEWREWPPPIREQLLRSVVTFINGITASTVANRNDWPPERQIGQLRLQLELLHEWAVARAAPARAPPPRPVPRPGPGPAARRPGQRRRL